MPGSYVALNLLPSDPFDLLASCIVSLTQRINKYVCMYVSAKNAILVHLYFTYNKTLVRKQIERTVVCRSSVCKFALPPISILYTSVFFVILESSTDFSRALAGPTS